MSAEAWKPIVEAPGYSVSDAGRVRSEARIDPAGNRQRSRVLAQQLNHKGYARVMLTISGRRASRLVHHLVLDAFVGTRPDGAQTRHLDGLKTNNTVGNLRWGTGSENSFDNVRHGVHPMASKTHCKRGHEFTPSNTHTFGPGNRWRQCRTCQSLRSAAHRAGTRLSQALQGDTP